VIAQPSVVAAFARVFNEAGWHVEQHEQLTERELSFDFAAESSAAVVFAKELAFEALERESKRLTAEVAATLQRRSVGVKAWEGYLLLLCTGDSTAHEKPIQDVQHDLSYCRKLVVAASEVEAASDIYSAARDKVAFLFPLELGASTGVGDVRRALVARLIAHGISRDLATRLVANFDEPTCHCSERLTGGAEGNREA
jgi:hypothetical protein